MEGADGEPPPVRSAAGQMKLDIDSASQLVAALAQPWADGQTPSSEGERIIAAQETEIAALRSRLGQQAEQIAHLEKELELLNKQCISKDTEIMKLTDSVRSFTHLSTSKGASSLDPDLGTQTQISALSKQVLSYEHLIMQLALMLEDVPDVAVPGSLPAAFDSLVLSLPTGAGCDTAGHTKESIYTTIQLIARKIFVLRKTKFELHKETQEKVSNICAQVSHIQSVMRKVADGTHGSMPETFKDLGAKVTALMAVVDSLNAPLLPSGTLQGSSLDSTTPSSVGDASSEVLHERLADILRTLSDDPYIVMPSTLPDLITRLEQACGCMKKLVHKDEGNVNSPLLYRSKYIQLRQAVEKVLPGLHNHLHYPDYSPSQGDAYEQALLDVDKFSDALAQVQLEMRARHQHQIALLSQSIHRIISLLGDVPDKALMEQHLMQMEAAFSDPVINSPELSHTSRGPDMAADYAHRLHAVHDHICVLLQGNEPKHKSEHSTLIPESGWASVDRWLKRLEEVVNAASSLPHAVQDSGPKGEDSKELRCLLQEFFKQLDRKMAVPMSALDPERAAVRSLFDKDNKNTSASPPVPINDADLKRRLQWLESAVTQVAALQEEVDASHREVRRLHERHCFEKRLGDQLRTKVLEHVKMLQSFSLAAEEDVAVCSSQGAEGRPEVDAYLLLDLCTPGLPARLEALISKKKQGMDHSHRSPVVTPTREGPAQKATGLAQMLQTAQIANEALQKDIMACRQQEKEVQAQLSQVLVALQDGTLEETPTLQKEEGAGGLVDTVNAIRNAALAMATRYKAKANALSEGLKAMEGRLKEPPAIPDAHQRRVLQLLTFTRAHFGARAGPLVDEAVSPDLDSLLAALTESLQQGASYTDQLQRSVAQHQQFMRALHSILGNAPLKGLEPVPPMVEVRNLDPVASENNMQTLVTAITAALQQLQRVQVRQEALADTCESTAKWLDCQLNTSEDGERRTSFAAESEVVFVPGLTPNLQQACTRLATRIDRVLGELHDCRRRLLAMQREQQTCSDMLEPFKGPGSRSSDSLVLHGALTRALDRIADQEQDLAMARKRGDQHCKERMRVDELLRTRLPNLIGTLIPMTPEVAGHHDWIDRPEVEPPTTAGSPSSPGLRSPNHFHPALLDRAEAAWGELEARVASLRSIADSCRRERDNERRRRRELEDNLKTAGYRDAQSSEEVRALCAAAGVEFIAVPGASLMHVIPEVTTAVIAMKAHEASAIKERDEAAATLAAARAEMHQLRERCMRAEHMGLQIANAVLSTAHEVDLLPALAAHSSPLSPSSSVHGNSPVHPSPNASGRTPAATPPVRSKSASGSTSQSPSSTLRTSAAKPKPRASSSPRRRKSLPIPPVASPLPQVPAPELDVVLDALHQMRSVCIRTRERDNQFSTYRDAAHGVLLAFEDYIACLPSAAESTGTGLDATHAMVPLTPMSSPPLSPLKGNISFDFSNTAHSWADRLSSVIHSLPTASGVPDICNVARERLQQQQQLAHRLRRYERQMAELLEALMDMGVDLPFMATNSAPPLLLQGSPVRASTASDGTASNPSSPPGPKPTLLSPPHMTGHHQTSPNIDWTFLQIREAFARFTLRNADLTRTLQTTAEMHRVALEEVSQRAANSLQAASAQHQEELRFFAERLEKEKERRRHQRDQESAEQQQQREEWERERMDLDQELSRTRTALRLEEQRVASRERELEELRERVSAERRQMAEDRVTIETLQDTISRYETCMAQVRIVLNQVNRFGDSNWFERLDTDQSLNVSEFDDDHDSDLESDATEEEDGPDATWMIKKLHYICKDIKGTSKWALYMKRDLSDTLQTIRELTEKLETMERYTKKVALHIQGDLMGIGYGASHGRSQGSHDHVGIADFGEGLLRMLDKRLGEQCSELGRLCGELQPLVGSNEDGGIQPVQQQGNSSRRVELNVHLQTLQSLVPPLKTQFKTLNEALSDNQAMIDAIHNAMDRVSNIFHYPPETLSHSQEMEDLAPGSPQPLHPSTGSTQIGNMQAMVRAMAEDCIVHRTRCLEFREAVLYILKSLVRLEGDGSMSVIYSRSDVMDDAITEYFTMLRTKLGSQHHEIHHLKQELTKREDDTKEAHHYAGRLVDQLRTFNKSLGEDSSADDDDDDRMSSKVADGGVSGSTLKGILRLMETHLLRVQQAITDSNHAKAKLQKLLKQYEESGAPQLIALEQKLQEMVQRVRELDAEVHERDLHLNVVMEGERQQRQLFQLFKEKSAQEIRELKEQLTGQRTGDDQLKAAKAQIDHLTSTLAITRNQYNDIKSQLALSSALSSAGIGFEQTIKDYHTLLEEAKAKLQQAEQEKRDLKQQLLQYQGQRSRVKGT